MVEKDVVHQGHRSGTDQRGFNLLHNPVEPKVEMGTVEMFLKYGCRTVSASAFMTLTPAIVRYRMSGIHRDAGGAIVCPNKVFAKVSRAEVAEPFMRPPTKALLDQCAAEGWLTAEEVALATESPWRRTSLRRRTPAGIRTAGRSWFCCRRSSDSATA